MPSDDSLQRVHRGIVVDQFGDVSLLDYLRERSRADPEGIDA